MAIFSDAPHTYTGEDSLELHVHGSPVVAREVLRSLLACGARYASAGEFTRRAFENGKLDLHAATAVADLIDSETRSAARAAAANLSGGLATDVRNLRRDLAEILEELSGAIDYPDEIPEPPRDRIDNVLERIERDLTALRRDGERGRLVREGISVAIVGPPNAGKSSLLNALLQDDRALVSDVAGTTRDTIEETVAIRGVAVRLIDTAGIRDHAGDLEAQGIERSRRALGAARLALVVIDGSKNIGALERQVLDETAGRERILFCNKSDLGDAGAREIADACVRGSARDGATLDALRDAIAMVGWGGERADLERPHLAALHEINAVNSALDALHSARTTLSSHDAIDFISGDLAAAFADLGHVTGDVAQEEVLDGIFARFCVGK